MKLGSFYIIDTEAKTTIGEYLRDTNVFSRDTISRFGKTYDSTIFETPPENIPLKYLKHIEIDTEERYVYIPDLTIEFDLEVLNEMVNENWINVYKIQNTEWFMIIKSDSRDVFANTHTEHELEFGVGFVDGKFELMYIPGVLLNEAELYCG